MRPHDRLGEPIYTGDIILDLDCGMMFVVNSALYDGEDWFTGYDVRLNWLTPIESMQGYVVHDRIFLGDSFGPIVRRFEILWRLDDVTF